MDVITNVEGAKIMSDFERVFPGARDKMLAHVAKSYGSAGGGDITDAYNELSVTVARLMKEYGHTTKVGADMNSHSIIAVLTMIVGVHMYLTDLMNQSAENCEKQAGKAPNAGALRAGTMLLSLPHLLRVREDIPSLIHHEINRALEQITKAAKDAG